MKIASIIISSSILILFSACMEEPVVNETTKQIKDANSAIEENMKLSKQNDYSGGKRDTSSRTDRTFHGTVNK